MKRNGLLGLALLGILLMGGCVNSNPEGGQYAVLLTVFSHPTLHPQDARLIKEETEELAGWEDLYIVHENGCSKLFRGPYDSEFKANRVMKSSKKYRDLGNCGAFVAASIIVLPPDDLGPKEWRLANGTRLRPDGSKEIRHTLLVAEFYNEGGFNERRQYTLDYCRELRERGYEAYYRHTAIKSYVTVGNFPEAAYTWQRTNRKVDARTGQDVTFASEVVLDPQLYRLTQELPTLAVNGSVVIETVKLHTGKTLTTEMKSKIMVIPEEGKPF